MDDQTAKEYVLKQGYFGVMRLGEKNNTVYWTVDDGEPEGAETGFPTILTYNGKEFSFLLGVDSLKAIELFKKTK